LLSWCLDLWDWASPGSSSMEQVYRLNAKFLELGSFSPSSIPEVSETALHRMA